MVTGRKESWAINKQTKQPNILIDDRPINIQRWTQAGGFGILYQANRDPYSKSTTRFANIQIPNTWYPKQMNMVLVL